MDYYSGQCKNLVVEHLFGLYGYKCLFVAARNKVNSKLHLFLIFKMMGKIFQRHGRHDTWEEVRKSDEYAMIKNLAEHALVIKKVHFISNAKLRPFFLKNFSPDDLRESFGKVGAVSS